MYPQRRRVLQTLGLALLITLVVLAVSACGGDEQQQGSKTRPLPEVVEQALRPGEYRSEEFEPSLSFRIGEGWATYTPVTPEVLRITRGE
jgi:hypothetical protein